jgi:hypothetical protein
MWKTGGAAVRKVTKVSRESAFDNRIQRPEFKMFRMSSSNVAAAGYDHGFKILRVRFVRGATYDYLEVPAIVHKELLDASSKGRFSTRILSLVTRRGAGGHQNDRSGGRYRIGLTDCSPSTPLAIANSRISLWAY